jgi:hypothetical protein
MTINKHWIRIAYYDGCHYNSCMKRLNHNTQTHEWEGPLYTGIFASLNRFRYYGPEIGRFLKYLTQYNLICLGTQN